VPLGSKFFTNVQWLQGFYFDGWYKRAHSHFPGWRFNSLICQDILFCINDWWLNEINRGPLKNKLCKSLWRRHPQSGNKYYI